MAIKHVINAKDKTQYKAVKVDDNLKLVMLICNDYIG